MNLKKIGELLTSKSVRTGPSSYEKGIYRAAVSQRLRNIALETSRLYTERYTGDWEYKCSNGKGGGGGGGEGPLGKGL